MFSGFTHFSNSPLEWLINCSINRLILHLLLCYFSDFMTRIHFFVNHDKNALGEKNEAHILPLNHQPAQKNWYWQFVMHLQVNYLPLSNCSSWYHVCECQRHSSKNFIILSKSTGKQKYLYLCNGISSHGFYQHRVISIVEGINSPDSKQRMIVLEVK